MMKETFKGTQYSVYQCETCGQKQYVFHPVTEEPKCISICCKEYGYNHPEYTQKQHCKLADLREKLIGTVIDNETTWVVLDILDFKHIVMCNIAGFELTVQTINTPKIPK